VTTASVKAAAAAGQAGRANKGREAAAMGAMQSAACFADSFDTVTVVYPHSHDEACGYFCGTNEVRAELKCLLALTLTLTLTLALTPLR
jgi:hypothetical protein